MESFTYYANELIRMQVKFLGNSFGWAEDVALSLLRTNLQGYVC